jgi:hypothetical protein
MGNLDSELSGFLPAMDVPPVSQISGIDAPGSGVKKVDDGISSIEKSKEVVAYFMPVANSPILLAPAQNGADSLAGIMAVATKRSGDLELIFRSVQMQMDSITDQFLDKWDESIRKINEEVQKIMTSPTYLHLQEIKNKGDPAQGNISGVMSVHAASAEQIRGAATDNASVASFFNHHAKAMEKVSAPSQVSESAGADDAAKMVVVPFVAATMIGGALALGSFEVSVAVNGMSSSPVSGMVEIVERLQPLLPQLLTDILPTINLLVMPLIYFTSWDSSIGNLKNKESSANEESSKNFAKEVLNLITNPAFIKINFIEQMLSSTPPGNRKEQKIAMMKLILACVALSLLYSQGVGKVTGGLFLGMEPEEFLGLLSGTLSVEHASQTGKFFSESQALQRTLIQQIKVQLDLLPPEEKMKVLNAIFDYFSVPRKMSSMLAPGEVIRKALTSSAFDPLADQMDKQAV